MRGKTHVVLGLAATSLFIPFNTETLLITTIATIGGSLLPDLDEVNSLLSRKLLIPSVILSILFLLTPIMLFMDKRYPTKYIFVLILILSLLISLEFITIKLLKYFRMYKTDENIFTIPGKILLGLSFLFFITTNFESRFKLPDYLYSISITLFFLSISLTIFTKHRSFSHSVIGFLLFNLSILIINKTAVLPFLIGYFMHLLADICSNTGVELFFPYSKRFNITNLSNGFFSKTIYTGSNMDRLLFIIGLASIPLILILKIR